MDARGAGQEGHEILNQAYFDTDIRLQEVQKMFPQGCVGI
jgi:6-phosphogluconate dehydrogenase (decarboxylating)